VAPIAGHSTTAGPTPSTGALTIGSVEELLAFAAAGDGLFDGDPVDFLAHGLQCAHQLRLRHPDDVELQVAGLLHDIGHQIVPGDDAGHGMAAATAVRGLLGERVAALIEHHVPAKRYLVATDPRYAALLTPTSVRTLGNQGGTMTPAELAAFEALPWWSDGLTVRRADDAAKIPGRQVPDLASWAPILRRVAAAQSATS
jgi:predicted HD phosphohydrolase